MFLKKPFYIVVIGFVIIIAVLFAYHILKFDYYEENLITKIRLHNKAVEMFFSKINKLDSITAKKFAKYDFYYLAETKELPESFVNDYEGYFKWIKDRTSKIILINNEIGLLLLNFDKKDTIPDEFLDLLEEGEKFDTMKKIDKKLMYTPDDLENIQDEVSEDQIEMYNKEFNKKAKKVKK